MRSLCDENKLVVVVVVVVDAIISCVTRGMGAPRMRYKARLLSLFC